MELTFRVDGALGLATVKVVGESVEEILTYAKDHDLEFMPSVLADGYVTITIGKE